jgi:hypothetical protein
MPEFAYQGLEAWNTSVKLAASIGRLKIGSNLRAAAAAQDRAFEQAGLAAALIAEASGREGGAAIGMYRDARGALAQARSWLHVLAAVTNENESVFGAEFDLAEQASRQVGGILRTLERAAPPPGRPAPRPGPPPQRPSGPPRGERR